MLASFIRSAVARQGPARAWDVSAPNLKEGVTRKEWNRGSLPVVPYPALDKGLGQWDYVEYSYRNSVGLEVFLFPKPGSGYSALTADVELVRDHGRWLVDYWMPKKFHGPPALASGGKAKKITRKAAGTRSHAPEGQGSAAGGRCPVSRPQSRLYWIIPIAILSLVVLVPIGLGIAHWIRARRAAREYAAWRSGGPRSRDAA